MSQTATITTPSLDAAPVSETFKFLSIPELKAHLNVETIDIVKSPTTSKLFAATPAGNFKVQANIDFAKPMRFMYQGELSTGCIVNVVESIIAVI